MSLEPKFFGVHLSPEIKIERLKQWDTKVQGSSDQNSRN